jgi:ribA/ribD-fused uncharacterized protein
MENPNYIFFYGHGAKLPKNYMSQWYMCKFSDYIYDYNNTEQYMMLQKAILFNDIETADKIIHESDPKKVKAFGRQVKGFNQELWEVNREDIVFQGNILKFEQNHMIASKLLSYINPTFVEASPYDKIWGIGFVESGALSKKHRWGLNLLGNALTKVYNELRKE